MIHKYEREMIKVNGCFSLFSIGIHKIKRNKVLIKTSYDDISIKLLNNEIKLYFYLCKHKYKFIPHLKNSGIYKNYPYIIMEFIQDKSFVVDKDLINHFFLILYKLHILSIVHRDIKPENFLYSTQNKLYIIDFGLSTYFNEGKKLKHMIGNSYYCSYNCYKEKYSYYYNDDILSLIYMLFHLYNNIDTILDKETKENGSFFNSYNDEINTSLKSCFFAAKLNKQPHLYNI